MKWNENLIAGALARQVFNRKALVVVPNCGWTGYECDLLVVMPDLRIIDVEIKINIADLKADIRKDKWYYRLNLNDWRAYRRGEIGRERRDWPQKIWKHYYAFPADLWRPELIADLPKNSGILLLNYNSNNSIRVKIERRAKPCRDAGKIAAADAIDIARLASLRMWDALSRLKS